MSRRKAKALGIEKNGPIISRNERSKNKKTCLNLLFNAIESNTEILWNDNFVKQEFYCDHFNNPKTLFKDVGDDLVVCRVEIDVDTVASKNEKIIEFSNENKTKQRCNHILTYNDLSIANLEYHMKTKHSELYEKSKSMKQSNNINNNIKHKKKNTKKTVQIENKQMEKSFCKMFTYQKRSQQRSKLPYSCKTRNATRFCGIADEMHSLDKGFKQIS